MPGAKESTSHFNGVTSKFAVGMPRTREPRPKPFTTGPHHHRRHGQQRSLDPSPTAIRSVNAGNPYRSKSKSYSECITSSLHGSNASRSRIDAPPPSSCPFVCRLAPHRRVLHDDARLRLHPQRLSRPRKYLRIGFPRITAHPVTTHDIFSTRPVRHLRREIRAGVDVANPYRTPCASRSSTIDAPRHQSHLAPSRV